MYVVIEDSNPEVDAKIRTMFNWILPSSGGKLYSVLDNPNLKDQTVNLDGKTIVIQMKSYGITVRFSPIIK